MYFDLQRFDTLSGPIWIKDGQTSISMLTVAYAFCFIPAGKTYTRNISQDNGFGPSIVHYSPDGNETIRIAVVDSNYIVEYGWVKLDGVEGQTTTTLTATLNNATVDDFIVTGSDRHLLRITIDGVEYMVGDDGHLVPASVSSGSIKVYHEGTAQVVANIYNAKTVALNLVIQHNNSDYYIPLTATKPSAPCLAVRNEGAIYYAMK